MLMVKSLTKEILKNKVFLALLLVMTIFTSFMFFFIRFSIDANMANLKASAVLSENEQNYMRALKSNTYLAFMMMIIIASLTALLFIMFYFRFFSSAKKQLGIYKALGVKNLNIQLYFTVFTVAFSSAGLLAGMLAGYFGSSVHLSANARSYNVTGLIKGINGGGVFTGLGLPLIIFAATMFICCFNLYKKENGILLSGVKQSEKQSKVLSFADACVKKLPIKNKAPLRIAVRKPFSILLIVCASTVFTVMLVMGWSLTQSSQAVYKTQTEGHHYLYESAFEQYQTGRAAGDVIYYLSVTGLMPEYNDEVEQTVFGMDIDDGIYALKNTAGESLGLPENGTCYIPVGLSEMYNIRAGATIRIETEDCIISLTVKDIAYNAKDKTVIVAREYLAGLLSIGSDSYNGVLSMDNLYPGADKVVDSAEREDALNRNKVSSAISAIINQSIGLASGVILIFLALFITFQDSVKDILIMDNMGYTKKEIKKLLINVFLPILIIGFAVTAFPAVLIAKGVQISLALQMGDYMPFSTNILVLIIGLVTVVAIYWLVQSVFSLGIRHNLKKKNILEYTNSL